MTFLDRALRMTSRYQIGTIIKNHFNRRTVIAEVGVNRGKHFASLYEADPSMIYAVDPWGEKAYRDDAEKAFRNKFAKRRNVTILKTTSLDAASQFSRPLFDVVYIDANHRYKHVIEDLKAWYPLISKGGILCGHDVNMGGVHKALTEFAELNHLAFLSDYRTRNFYFPPKR